MSGHNGNKGFKPKPPGTMYPKVNDNVVCFKCGDHGHYANQCPRNQCHAVHWSKK